MAAFALSETEFHAHTQRMLDQREQAIRAGKPPESRAPLVAVGAPEQERAIIAQGFLDDRKNSPFTAADRLNARVANVLERREVQAHFESRYDAINESFDQRIRELQDAVRIKAEALEEHQKNYREVMKVVHEADARYAQASDVQFAREQRYRALAKEFGGPTDVEVAASDAEFQVRRAEKEADLARGALASIYAERVPHVRSRDPEAAQKFDERQGNLRGAAAAAQDPILKQRLTVQAAFELAQHELQSLQLAKIAYLEPPNATERISELAREQGERAELMARADMAMGMQGKHLELRDNRPALVAGAGQDQSKKNCLLDDIDAVAAAKDAAVDAKIIRDQVTDASHAVSEGHRGMFAVSREVDAAHRDELAARALVNQATQELGETRQQLEATQAAAARLQLNPAHDRMRVRMSAIGEKQAEAETRTQEKPGIERKM